jgi:hypothetical protein
MIAAWVKMPDGSAVKMEDVTPLIQPPMTPEELAAQVARLKKA